jgi:hypothetical protein
MNDLIENINEATFGDLKKKQKDITQLFPSFFDRVESVRLKGGVRMVKETKDYWEFQIHSGTKEDTWYTVRVWFKGIPEVLRYASKESGAWKSDQSGVNLSKISRQVFYNCDIKFRCFDPSDLYWGFQYVRSQPDVDAINPPPEDRYPIVRNPRLRGAYCKHVQLLLNLLPMYIGTFSKWLKKYYLSDISNAEKFAKKEGFRKEEKESEL